MCASPNDMRNVPVQPAVPRSGPSDGSDGLQLTEREAKLACFIIDRVVREVRDLLLEVAVQIQVTIHRKQEITAKEIHEAHMRAVHIVDQLKAAARQAEHNEPSRET